jgi:uncharacterized SAM-binding protein YcdF (DUF218 family)
MKKRYYLLLGLLLLGLCFGYIVGNGQTYTLKVNTAGMGEIIDFHLDKGEQIVKITDTSVDDDSFYITLQSVSKGKDTLVVTGKNSDYLETVYVHNFGIITINTFYGRFNGGRIIPVGFAVYLAVILWGTLKKYRQNMKESMYQYQNIVMLGLIIFILPLLLDLIVFTAGYQGLDSSVRSLVGTISQFAVVALPIAFVVFVMVTVSNIQLMKKEGRSWTNMLGAILGILLCLSTILPLITDYYLYWFNPVIDVHNQNHPIGYIFNGLENMILIEVGYFECILLASIILSIKAARHVPSFDKDCIMILGCQIREDGSVTPLLKGRADRALEFARMQKEKTGRDIVFVPSGGKGDDEIISEGEAIRNYLVSTGIDENRIIVEEKSVNTRENFSNSVTLIKEYFGGKDPVIAFSTTNYHVFRSGILARQLGINAEGIGSPTKNYFWINAFVREFIATVLYGWKIHMAVTLINVFTNALMQQLRFISNNR